MEIEQVNLTTANVLEYIERRMHVSMVELVRHFEGAAGELNYGDKEHNIIYWSGVSEELISVLNELFGDVKIYAIPTDVLTYLIDGGVLQVPLAKRPNWKYKSLRWLPIALEPVSQFARQSPEFQAKYRKAVAEGRLGKSA